MRSFTVAERRSRLARRHFLSADTPATSVTDLADAVVGLHATDPATPYLTCWARMPGFAVEDLQREMYERRSVVKHLAMRRTLWVVTAERLPLIQAAASDRVADTERRRLVADALKAGITDDGDAWLDAACAAVLAHLGVHGTASSSQLRKALPELAGEHDYAPGKPWGGPSPLAPRVLTVLSVRGDIVRGHNEGAWTVARPRWSTVGDWLGSVPEPAKAAGARAELVGCWLRAFGPATLADIKWWFGSTLTAIRQALRDIGAVEVDLHGSPGWALADDLEPEPDAPPWVALLPALDVTTMGHSERSWYLGEHKSQVFDTNGNGGPTAWCDGRIVGAWGQDAEGRVRVELLEDPGRTARRALERTADQLTEWLDGVRVSPRFPSALSKSIVRR